MTALLLKKLLSIEDHGRFRAAARRHALELAPECDLSAMDLMLIGDLEELSGISCAAFRMMLVALLRSRRRSWSCLPLEKEIVASLLADLETDVDQHLRNFIEQHARGDYAAAIGEAYGDPLPLIVMRRGTTHTAAFSAAARTEARLAELLFNETPVRRVSFEDSSIPSTVDDLQRRATLLPLSRRISVVSGGPGTGKTFTIAMIVRCFIDAGVLPRRIKLCAPTGRAAYRVTESVRGGAAATLPSVALDELQGMTVHRLLKYHPSLNAFAMNSVNRIDAEIVICDEASMLDARLLRALLEALPDDCRLVLVGDGNQLPPVGEGAVFANLAERLAPVSAPTPEADDASTVAAAPELASARGIGAVFLRKNHRSSSTLSTVAEKIIDGAGAEEVLSGFARNDPSAFDSGTPVWLDPESAPPGMVDAFLDEWMAKWFGGGVDSYLDRLHHAVTGAERESLVAASCVSQILAAVNEGRRGRTRINDAVLRAFRRKSALAQGLLPAGTPIIMLDNDYELELFNGDRGVVMRDESGAATALFSCGGDSRSIPIENLSSYDAAFAITVHKSQGSEFENVLLMLPESGAERVLTRPLIYTALTRAKLRLAVLGSAAAFSSALHAPEKRYSLFL